MSDIARCQKRLDQLIAAAQAEAICEHRMETATTDQEKGMAQINLEGAREWRDSLLRKWGKFPPTA